MRYPERSRIESALLQELKAVGEDKPRFLYQRLARYFPQLETQDLSLRTRSGRSRWRVSVQRAKRALMERGEVASAEGRWTITDKGRERAESEDMPIQLVLPISGAREQTFTHDEIKRMLVEIGRLLGNHAEEEYQRYDVVWRDSPRSPRLSHVFEVQVNGKLEGALSKLKHAYDVQRSRPFLVVAYERDQRRVREFLAPYMVGTFHEIADAITVLSPQEVFKLHSSLTHVSELLGKVMAD